MSDSPAYRLTMHVDCDTAPSEIYVTRVLYGPDAIAQITGAPVVCTEVSSWECHGMQKVETGWTITVNALDQGEAMTAIDNAWHRLREDLAAGRSGARYPEVTATRKETT